MKYLKMVLLLELRVQDHCNQVWTFFFFQNVKSSISLIHILYIFYFVLMDCLVYGGVGEESVEDGGSGLTSGMGTRP